VSIVVDGAWRTIDSNGIPNHAHGRFPNPHDPNPIRAQNYHYRMAAQPVRAAAVTSLDDPQGRSAFIFGMAVNGLQFDPYGPWYRQMRPWHFEVMAARRFLGLDQNNAHVKAAGEYHYHGMPTGLIAITRTSGMALLGYAADGFPIYADSIPRDPNDLASPTITARSSYRLREGSRESAPGGRYDGTFCEDYEYVVGLGDLDDCNGREGKTPEYPDGTFYYVLTNAYPYIPQFFRGTPDESFRLPFDPVHAPLPPELAAYQPAT
jgi:hypothetical protein